MYLSRLNDATEHRRTATRTRALGPPTGEDVRVRTPLTGIACGIVARICAPLSSWCRLVRRAHSPPASMTAPAIRSK
jgi:hypothetical protein